MTGDDAGAEHQVAYCARPGAARAGQAGSDHATHRRLAVEGRRLAGQCLALIIQRGKQLDQRSATAYGHHQFGGIVVDDAAVAPGIQHLAIDRAAEKGFAVGALDRQRGVAVQSIEHLLLQLLFTGRRGAFARAMGMFVLGRHQKRSSSGKGNSPLWICMAPNSAQRFSVGMFLPGLSRPSGSNAAFTAWKVSSSSSLNCEHIWLIFSRPTPCSPVIEPPTATQSSRILPPTASARSSSPSWLASNRISGCMLPSPAWNTLATRRPYSADRSAMPCSTLGSSRRGMVPSMQ